MLGKGVVGGGGGSRAPKPSFVSYVRPEEIHTNEKEAEEKEVTLHLLPGEQLLCQAGTVLKYVQEDSCQRGVYGKLVCTNFKIAFLGSDDESAAESDETQFKNKIIGENDITLHCVDQIYGVFDEKKKPLFGQLKKYPEKLIIHCKDLRVFHFCLRYTKEEDVKRIVSGIIHHTLASKRLKRLFLFSYAAAVHSNTPTDPQSHTVMFDTLADWRWELERTGGNVKYKAVSVNQGYRVCESIFTRCASMTPAGCHRPPRNLLLLGVSPHPTTLQPAAAHPLAVHGLAALTPIQWTPVTRAECRPFPWRDVTTAHRVEHALEGHAFLLLNSVSWTGCVNTFHSSIHQWLGCGWSSLWL